MDIGQLGIGAGVAGIFIAVITWLRFKSKDKADTSKTEA